MPTTLEIAVILFGFVSLILLLALMILRAAKWDDALREELLRSFRDELEAESERVVAIHSEPNVIPLQRVK